MPPEARLERVGTGLTPVSDGWFVVNARDAAWISHDTFGLRFPFETNGPVARAADGVEERTFPQLGFHLAVLQPGQPGSLYHAEESQEDFLVLSGECTVVIEEQELRLRAWDLVHCPPGTRHSLIGAGDGQCMLVMVGSRFGDPGIRYPASPVACSHGAAVEAETDSARQAYARFGPWRNAGPANPAEL